MQVRNLTEVSLGCNQGVRLGCIPFWIPQGAVHFLALPGLNAAHMPCLMAPILHFQSQQCCMYMTILSDHSWDSVADLKDPFDQIGPIWLIQNNLLIARPLTESHMPNVRQPIHRVQGIENGHLWRVKEFGQLQKLEKIREMILPYSLQKGKQQQKTNIILNLPEFTFHCAMVYFPDRQSDHSFYPQG